MPGVFLEFNYIRWKFYILQDDMTLLFACNLNTFQIKLFIALLFLPIKKNHILKNFVW